MTEDMESSLDAASKVSEVLLLMDTHQGSFLLVEGEHDEEFYSNVVSETDCKIVYCLGKRMVKEVVANLVNGPLRVTQVIGIIDADYDRVRYCTPRQYPNIFRTDTHDLEMMIIQTHAFNKIVNVYIDKTKSNELQKRRGLDLRTLLLKEGAAIGCLFMICLPKDQRLELRDLEFEKFVSAQELEVDLGKLVDYVIDRTPGCRLNRSTLLAELKKLLLQGHDPWQLCNGHHLVRILTIGINEGLGKRPKLKVNPLRIETELKLAYERSSFKSTDLFRQILDWEEDNAPFKILEDSLRN